MTDMPQPPQGPPRGPAPGPGAPAAPTADAGARRRQATWFAVVAAALVVVIVAVVAMSGGASNDAASSASTSGSDGVAGSAEVFLEPADEPGADPFSESVAAPTPSSTAPAGPIEIGQTGITAPAFRPAASGSVQSYRGGVPGLYGGTMNMSSCDLEQMVSFLTANPDKAAAWAAAQGIAVSAVPTFLRELTPVLLRADTRVTNYGFAGGAATPRQSVLEAGTAVLVDKYGEPQAKCACGNPLNPPIALAGPIYVGSRWPGFTPGGVTVVVKNTTVIKIITIIDIRTGEPFGRPPGGGRDLPVPTTTTTPATTVPVTSPTAPPQTSPPVKPPPPPPTSPPVPAIWRLVDFTQTVAELPTAWTVNAQGGTARVSLPPNEGNYSWTVPQEIGPSGTTVTFGGSSVGNIAIDIQVSGDGNLAFNTADLRATAGSDQSVSKSAVVRVTNLEAGEVRLSYGMGFSVGVTYIYRRG